jgi:hypothetical protein
MYSVSSSSSWSTYAQGWLGLWSAVQSLTVFWLLLLLVPIMIFVPQILRVLWRKERYPEFLDSVIELERYKLSDHEGQLSKYVVPPSENALVRLPGSDDAPSDITAQIGPLPLPGSDESTSAVSSAVSPPGSPPGAVLAALPGFGGPGAAPARTGQGRCVV